MSAPGSPPPAKWVPLHLAVTCLAAMAVFAVGRYRENPWSEVAGCLPELAKGPGVGLGAGLLSLPLTWAILRALFPPALPPGSEARKGRP